MIIMGQLASGIAAQEPHEDKQGASDGSLLMIIMVQLVSVITAQEPHEDTQGSSNDMSIGTDNSEVTGVCSKENSECDTQDTLVVNKESLEDPHPNSRAMDDNSIKEEQKVEDTHPNSGAMDDSLVKEGQKVEEFLIKNDKTQSAHLSTEDILHEKMTTQSSDLDSGEKEEQTLDQKSDVIEEGAEVAGSVDKSDNITSNSSSVMGEWFRYFVDSFLEEFKEGVISKQPEQSNQTNSSEIEITPNETIAVNVSTIEIPPDTTKNDTEVQNSTDTGKKMKFECIGRNVTDNSNATVRIITSAKLLQLLTFDKNDTENITDCIVVMFYAPWCKFCARTAPHFNALARAFPQLDFVAVDTAQFSNILARFGTVSVPNVLVFHQSRSTVKFNQTERVFPNFVSFLKNATGLEPNTSVEMTEADYIGPVPSIPTDDPDYLLLLSWLFVIFCSMCLFVKSTKGQQWITRVRVLWQEHQHID